MTIINDSMWYMTQNKVINSRTTGVILKRILDASLSSVALLFLLPAFAVIALFIKLDSPGSVIFRQTRIGKSRKPFTVYKFRTMRDGDNSATHRQFIKSLFNENYQRAEDSVYKVTDDGRVTRVGAILRKTSLDELPQLINVLKGEMSLVGPRPDLPYSVDLYEQRHLQRLSVLPGITGLWQVSGRSNRSLLEMLDLDVEYVNNRSFWLDIKILARTIIVVITEQGAS